MSHVLAIDLGSSGVKVAVVDREGQVLGGGSAPLATTYLPGGGAEQDPEEWWDAVGACARKALADGHVDGVGVEAVVVTAQYMSIVPIDAGGRPVGNVIMWMDRRGRRHHPALGDPDAAAMWIQRHGLPPLPTDDQAHIAFLRNERPDVYDAAAAFVEPVDYLNARLTGRITATQTTAFPLMTVDNRVHGATEYDADLVGWLGVDPDKLPPLVPHDEVLGRLLPEAAVHLGVSPEAVVVAGTIDSITSAVGCGAIDDTTCSVVIGTTTVIVTHVDAKASDLDHGLISVPSPLPGRYFVMAENGVGGKALEWFLQHVYGDEAFARVEAAAASVSPGSGGVLFFPWLAGSIAPSADGNMRGGFVNIGLDTTQAHLARAVYEGVALNAAWLFPHVAAFARAGWTAVRFGGGGAASALWAQVLADALAVDVDQLAGPHTTNARGAAFLALERLGHITIDDIPGMLRVQQRFSPDAERVALYQRLAEHFMDFHVRNRPFYAALNRRPT